MPKLNAGTNDVSVATIYRTCFESYLGKLLLPRSIRFFFLFNFFEIFKLLRNSVCNIHKND
ncbi:hypothetical protein BpHYR1_025128 [Brachionus plicatilis]|uniref:Uncharacterized protein n=1 Tax=Brachionus plicatilis TaxID=10195 RepID=A0A3M7RSH6_BRAPC|nr:hypothetical protein BpHYR1_025128 [Brachionus plicatilis]